MVLGLMPAMSLTVSAADAMPTSGTATLANGKTYEFQTGTYTRNANFIIASGTVTVHIPANANVTINGIFDGINKVGSPFVVRSGATLNLIINGKLTCNGSQSPSTTGSDPLYNSVYAGINVAAGGTLNITTETGDGSTTGVLIAQAGNITGDGSQGSAAGIGGNGYKDDVAAESCGTVMIGKNTNVTAKGSVNGGGRGAAAGIGGGGGGDRASGGNGGNITIYGTVYAEGARGPYLDGGGAGIGGGGSFS